MRQWIDIVCEGAIPGLDEIAAKFAEAHPEYATPKGAHDNCQKASVEFLDACQEAGYRDLENVELIVVDDTIHRGARVGNIIYDWTARQYNPAAPWPLIMRTNISEQKIARHLGLTPSGVSHYTTRQRS